MADDRDDFSRRAEQACASAFSRDEEGVEVAGHLALAYRALARRRAAAAAATAEVLPEAEAPLLLQE
jgi:hypothetical protein